MREKHPSTIFVFMFIVVDIILAAIILLMLLGHSSVESYESSISDFQANDSDYDEVSVYLANSTVNFSSATSITTSSNTNASQDTQSAADAYAGFVFPDSNTVLLTSSRISSTVKDAQTCRRAINEIYARHGYQFSLQDNIDFFNQYSWYQSMTKESDMDKVSAQFNATETKNVDLLQQYENQNNWN